MIRLDQKAQQRAALVTALRGKPQLLGSLCELSTQLQAILDNIASEIGDALGLLQQPASSTRVITVVNQSTVVKDDDFQAAVAAVQQQVSSDLAQAWDLGSVTVLAGPDTNAERVYVLDNSQQAGVLGYHTEDNSLVPVGFVFAADSAAAGGDWATTLSHEVLEQIIDPYTVGIMLAALQGQTAGLALEVCDPVENDTYQVAGRAMSSFVFPEWFNPGFTGPVDQLGRLQAAGALSQGGYAAYTTDLQSWQQMFGQLVPAAKRQAGPLSRLSRRFRKAVRKSAPPTPVKK